MSNQESNSAIGDISRIPVPKEADLREIVSRALKSCSKRTTREQVAQEITARIPQPVDEKITITKRMLDDWATPSKTGLRVPAFLIKPLCEITGDDALALAVIPSHLHKYIAVGKWVMGSEWVLDMITVKLRKDGRRLLRLGKIF